MIKEDLSFLLPSLKGNKEEIKGIYLNSKEVQKDSLFIALEGQNYNGNDFIKEAKKKGASLIFSSSLNSPFFIPNLKKHINEIYMKFYNLKQKVRLIGITGTNGKSSLSDFVTQLLLLDKKKVKNFALNSSSYSVKTDLTTPFYPSLIKGIKENNDLDYLILECSSIGISEERVSSLEFDYKILTNIYEDHLDYHKNINNYVKSKISFLTSSSSNIIMSSKDYYKFKNDFIEKKVIVKGSFKIIKESMKGTIFLYNGKTYKTRLIGKQNIENLTSLITLGVELKIKSLKKKIKKIKPLKGRFDIVSYRPLVLIDYAHTSSSMEYVLSEVKRIFKKKIILVFGAGGDREKEKRKEYGEIALKYSFFPIVTNDNPRHENEDDIINDIINIKKQAFYVKKNRSEAIRLALSKADENSLVLILGKGNEERMEKEGKLIPFNDYEEVRKCL